MKKIMNTTHRHVGTSAIYAAFWFDGRAGSQSHPQLHDGCAAAAFVLRRLGNRLYMRMLLQ